MSYTNFKYGNAKISSDKLKRGGSIIVSVEISNTGSQDGEEIVQLYIHDKVASVARPVKELKDFEKINLKKGETKTVKFTINEETISMYNIDMKWIAEPGEFDVWISTSSDDESQHLKFSLKE